MGKLAYFWPTLLLARQGFKASNPRTQRFLPFTHAPRQCLGMNFAQMEMRVLLSTIVRRFDLALAAPTVRAARGRLSALRILHCKSVSVWRFLWARRALNI